MRDLSEIEARALALLREIDGASCTTLGKRLWPARRKARPQALARPAGAVLQRLHKLELVYKVRPRDCAWGWIWHACKEG